MAIRKRLTITGRTQFLEGLITPPPNRCVLLVDSLTKVFAWYSHASPDGLTIALSRAAWRHDTAATRAPAGRREPAKGVGSSARLDGPFEPRPCSSPLAFACTTMSLP
jgi:hypothetical protein